MIVLKGPSKPASRRSSSNRLMRDISQGCAAAAAAADVPSWHMASGLEHQPLSELAEMQVRQKECLRWHS